MRILLVCPAYHGYDTAIAHALEHLGHEVTLLSYFPSETLAEKVKNRVVDEVLPRIGAPGARARRIDGFNRLTLEALEGVRPELSLVVKGDILSPKTVAALSEQSVAVHWAFDDPYRYPLVVDSLAHYRLIASFARSDVQRLVDDGLPAFYLPDGFDSFEFGQDRAPAPAAWHKEVSFLGARYAEREAILAEVAAVADLGIWGGDWKRRPWRARYYQRRTVLDRACMGWAGPREADMVYRACAVNLNIHGGSWDGLNMRVFEIPGAGGFQLCDARPGLEEVFEPGLEIAVHRSQDEMLGMVAGYLQDTPARARIAAAGRKRAHAEHTLVRRMSTLLGRPELHA